MKTAERHERESRFNRETDKIAKKNAKSGFSLQDRDPAREKPNVFLGVLCLFAVLFFFLPSPGAEAAEPDTARTSTATEKIDFQTVGGWVVADAKALAASPARMDRNTLFFWGGAAAAVGGLRVEDSGLLLTAEGAGVTLDRKSVV